MNVATNGAVIIDREQELVLLRLDAGLARGLLAEGEELAHLRDVRGRADERDGAAPD
jgi:hypothetical protein